MISEFLKETIETILRLDERDIEKVIDVISRSERLFIIGSGGGAGNASHAVSDFRKLCEKDAFTFENISELTARVNDQGWGDATTEWLKGSSLNCRDCLFVISVGGGQPGVSLNLVNAIEYADLINAYIVGIVGAKECSLTKYADASIVIDTKNFRTPIVEGLQSVLTHLIVTSLQKNKTVW